MTSFKGYLFVAVPRAVGVHKVKEVAVVLPTQLLHLVLRQISQGGKELFLHLDRILVWLEVPLYKKKEEKEEKKRIQGRVIRESEQKALTEASFLKIKLEAIIPANKEFLSKNEAELAGRDIKGASNGGKGRVALRDTDIPLKRQVQKISKEE